MREWMLEGAQSFGRSGKAANPALALPQRSVSRAHGLFVTDAGGCRYQDVGSTNGTLLNGTMLAPQRPYLLKDGDVLRIHAGGDEANEMDVVMIYTTSWHDGAVWKSSRWTSAWRRSWWAGRRGWRSMTERSRAAMHRSSARRAAGRSSTMRA